MEPIKTIKKGPFTLEIQYDTDPRSPFDDENIPEYGIDLSNRRDYRGDEFGEKFPMNVTDFLFQMRQGPATKEAKELDDKYYWTYVYMLQHGSTTVSTKPFNDPWDSGTAGIIFISKKMLIEMYYPDIKRQTLVEKKEKAAMKFFEQQVELLDDMFNGRCYGYTVSDETGENLESCWGYWGDSEYAENEGMDALNVLLEKYIKEKMDNPDPEVIITHRVREAIADLVAYCSDPREWEDWVENGYSNNHVIHSAAVVKSRVLGDKSLQKEIDEEIKNKD